MVKKQKAIDKLIEKADPAATLAYLRASGTSDQVDLETLLALAALFGKAKNAEGIKIVADLLAKIEIEPAQLPKVATDLSNAGANEAALQCIALMGDDRNRFGVLELEARCYRALDRKEEAAQVFERMQRLFPYAIKTWTGSANHFKVIGDHEREADALTQALSLKLKDVQILKRLAALAASGGDKRVAFDLYRQVLRINPDDQEGIVGLAEQLIRSKKFEEADAVFARCKDQAAADKRVTKVRDALARWRETAPAKVSA